MQWLDAVLQGLMLGGVYALFALGLSLMFGVMQMVNTAHGDLVVLLAYAALVLVGSVSNNPFVILLVLAPGAMLAGYALQRFVLNRTLGADPLPSIIATFGLAVIIQNLLLTVFTADARALPTLRLEGRSFNLFGDIRVGWLASLALLSSVLITSVFAVFLRSTRAGRELRAAADDAQAASMMGIDPQHVYALATGLAFLLLAVAAVFQGMRVTFSPADGPAQLIFAFEAVILGGLGSVWGGLVGGLVLGVAQSVGFRVSPGWGVLFGHLVFLAMLAIRPRGLFPRGRT